MALEGQQLGRYRLQRLLGKGGMGEVYLALDTGIDRQVALKVIRSDVAFEPGTDAIPLFQDEMRIIARLNHPYILPLFDYGEAIVNGTLLPYMVMPYGSEGSLADWLKQRVKNPLLSPEEVAHFVDQAAEALQYSHNQQIIHRDVKPSNFLIQIHQNNPNRPDLLLADFGLARLLSASSHTTLTIGGTPSYMAPEQWEGFPVPATDQYMLAAMAYELLAGHPPFQGTLPQLIYQHIQNSPELCSKFNPQVSSQLDEVISRALAKRPQNRFPDISAFSQAFLDAVQNPASKRDDPNATRDSSSLAPFVIPIADAKTDPPAIQPPITLPAAEEKNASSSSDKYLQTLTSSTSNHGLNLNLAASKQGLRCSVILLFSLALLIIGSSTIYFGLNYNRSTSGSVASSNSQATANAQATSLARGQNTASANATVTVVAGATAPGTGHPDPYPPFTGMLVLNDPLSGNNQGNNWQTYQDSLSSCQFAGGAYHVTENLSGFFADCFSDPYFSDFTYEVQMQIVHGDCGGIMFRGDATHSKFYYFRVCQDGSYTLFLYKDNKSADAQTLTRGSSLSIHTGLSKTNIIAVVANGSQLSLYANQNLIVNIINSSYTRGHVGVAAEDIGNQTEVVFSNAKVWTL